MEDWRPQDLLDLVKLAGGGGRHRATSSRTRLGCNTTDTAQEDC